MLCVSNYFCFSFIPWVIWMATDGHCNIFIVDSINHLFIAVFHSICPFDTWTDTVLMSFKRIFHVHIYLFAKIYSALELSFFYLIKWFHRRGE